MTRAPRFASTRVQYGPARMRVRSMTTTPASGRGSAADMPPLWGTLGARSTARRRSAPAGRTPAREREHDEPDGKQREAPPQIEIDAERAPVALRLRPHAGRDEERADDGD